MTKIIREVLNMFWLFVLLVCYPGCYQTFETCFVSSNTSQQCLLTLNISNVSEHSCKTFNEYATETTWLDTVNDGVSMIFLQGTHNLNRNFNINQNLTMKGQPVSGNNYNLAQIVLVLRQGNITIQHAARVTISNLTVDGISSNTLSIKEVSDVSIKNVVMIGTALLIQCVRCNEVSILNTLFVGSVLVIAWPDPYQNTRYDAYKKVLIKDTAFHLSPVGNGLSCCNVRSISMINISLSELFRTSTAQPAPPESGLITFCAYYPWGIQFREECDLLTSSFLLLEIYDSMFKRSTGTGVCISVPTNAEVYFVSSTIRDHKKGGAMFESGPSGTRVILRNNSISNNINTLLGSATASALRIYTVEIVDTHPHAIPEIYIIQCHFIGNIHLGNTLLSTVSIHSHIRAYIIDSEFVDNYGSGITAYTKEKDHVFIIFSGTILLKNNTSHRGGAIHLYKSRIGLKKGVRILFEQNDAKDVGGAMYVHSTQWLSSYYNLDAGNYGDCFYVLIDCDTELYTFNLTFHKNSAQNGGEHIFGAALLSFCNICPHSPLAPSTQDNIFNLLDPDALTFSPISSHPSRVCICDNTLEHYNPHYFCPNTSNIFITRSVYPGEEFTFAAVLVGAEFGAVTGSVYAQFLAQRSSKLYPPHQYSQRVDVFSMCTQLSYTVHSSNSREVLVLTSSDQTVLQYGNQEVIQKESDSYIDEILLKYIPPNLLTTPVYINLTLLPCPLGFHLLEIPPKCDCTPPFTTNDMFCNFTNGTGYIYRNDTTWIGTLNESAVLIQTKCPFDYCIAELTGVDLEHPDTQCAMNHAGVLCGGCKKGFSMALGTNMCLPCTNNKKLGLLLAFAIAGVLLIVLIKVLNLTVSQGTINGLIFYANIVWAYQDVVFPTRVRSRWFVFIRVFITLTLE